MRKVVAAVVLALLAAPAARAGSPAALSGLPLAGRARPLTEGVAHDRRAEVFVRLGLAQRVGRPALLRGERLMFLTPVAERGPQPVPRRGVGRGRGVPVEVGGALGGDDAG